MSGEKKVKLTKDLVYEEYENCWNHGVSPTGMLEAFVILTGYFEQGYNPKDYVEVEDGNVLFHVDKNKIHVYDTRNDKKRKICTLTLN
jgi:hypothetical protein